MELMLDAAEKAVLWVGLVSLCGVDALVWFWLTRAVLALF